MPDTFNLQEAQALLKKPGGSITSHGYRIIYVGKKHPLADCRGYAYAHRIVGSIKVGRWLKTAEQVHHDDERGLNNEPSNLIVAGSLAEHKLHHRKPNSKLRLPDEDNPDITCACGCGATLSKFDKFGRPRRYIAGHFKRRGRANPLISCACGCGATFLMYDQHSRPRRFKTGHNPNQFV
jgi:hypothetical protein